MSRYGHGEGSWKRGSMTVEAVFVVSLILLLILWMMKESISMYQQVVETAQEDWVDISGIVSQFRKIHFLKDFLP